MGLSLLASSEPLPPLEDAADVDAPQASPAESGGGLTGVPGAATAAHPACAAGAAGTVLWSMPRLSKRAYVQGGGEEMCGRTLAEQAAEASERRRQCRWRTA